MFDLLESHPRWSVLRVLGIIFIFAALGALVLGHQHLWDVFFLGWLITFLSDFYLQRRNPH